MEDKHIYYVFNIFLNIMMIKPRTSWMKKKHINSVKQSFSCLNYMILNLTLHFIIKLLNIYFC